MSSKLPILQVAAKAAIVNSSGKVLIVRESALDKNNTKVGKWGLVGGRLKPGEQFEVGLKREVFEETGLEVNVIEPLYVGEWRPVVKGIEYQIIAIFMLCKTRTDKPALSKEHDKYAWIEPGHRTDFEMMEPDCYVVDELIDLL